MVFKRTFFLLLQALQMHRGSRNALHLPIHSHIRMHTAEAAMQRANQAHEEQSGTQSPAQGHFNTLLEADRLLYLRSLLSPHPKPPTPHTHTVHTHLQD